MAILCRLPLAVWHRGPEALTATPQLTHKPRYRVINLKCSIPDCFCSYRFCEIDMVHLTGWRFAAFIGGLVSVIGVTIYPIIIDPWLDASEYKKRSAEIRQKAGIVQSEVQPGGMKVWSDPFDRK